MGGEQWWVKMIQMRWSSISSLSGEGALREEIGAGEIWTDFGNTPYPAHTFGGHTWRTMGRSAFSEVFWKISAIGIPARINWRKILLLLIELLESFSF